MAKTKTYQDVMAEIARLREEADQLRAAEVAEVIAKMRVAIAAYELTPADLFGSPKRGKTKTKTKTKTKVATKRAKRTRKSAAAGKGGGAALVRFRDDAGNTWGGRGKRPEWFKAALKAGKTPDELRVN